DGQHTAEAERLRALEALHADLVERQQQLAGAQDKIRLLEERVGSLTARLSGAEAEHAAEIERLRTRLQHASSEAASLAETAADLKRQLAHAEEERTHAQAALSAATRAKLEQADEAARLGDELRRLQEDL